MPHRPNPTHPPAAPPWKPATRSVPATSRRLRTMRQQACAGTTPCRQEVAQGRCQTPDSRDSAPTVSKLRSVPSAPPNLQTGQNPRLQPSSRPSALSRRCREPGRAPAGTRARTPAPRPRPSFAPPHQPASRPSSTRDSTLSSCTHPALRRSRATTRRATKPVSELPRARPGARAQKPPRAPPWRETLLPRPESPLARPQTLASLTQI